MRDTKIWLGTALWGWSIDEDVAASLLDCFSARGGGVVDTAVNYPINGDPASFGLSLAYLERWLERHGADDIIKVYCKLGAVDNLGSGDADLTPENMLRTTKELQSRFGENLSGIAVHWDNRDDKGQIKETLDVMAALAAEGLDIGFSGVRHPALYREIMPDLADKWHIQVKDNITTHAAFESYADHFPEAQYIAYGINMGGVKSNHAASSQGSEDEKSSLFLRGLCVPDIAERMNGFISLKPSFAPYPETLNELSVLMTCCNDNLDGFICGASKPWQLEETLNYVERLAQSQDLSKIKPLLNSALFG